MKITLHQLPNNSKAAEVTSDIILIETVEDGLNLLASLYYEECDAIVLYEKNITPNFFDLKTGIAGEILQKFSNYRMRLAIVGDFTRYQSKSLSDFMFESNKHKHINFVGSLTEVIVRWS